MKVAVLGLGLMGSGIAQNLLGRGYEVHGYNRTPEKTKALGQKGVTVRSTPSETVSAGVDVAITMLTDQEAVHEVALGAQGFLHGKPEPGDRGRMRKAAAKYASKVKPSL